MTTFEFSSEELDLLSIWLQARLAELPQEISHTDNRAFREGLRREQKIIQGLLAKLQARTEIASAI